MAAQVDDLVPKHMCHMKLKNVSELDVTVSGLPERPTSFKVDLNDRLGNHNGSLTTHGRNFSRSARDFWLQGNVLVAELKTVSQDWTEDRADIRVTRLSGDQGLWPHNFSLICYVASWRKTFGTLEIGPCFESKLEPSSQWTIEGEYQLQYPEIYQGPEDDCRNLRLGRDGRLLAAECRQPNGRYFTTYFPEGAVLGNNNGRFDSARKRYWQFAEEPRLSHFTLNAKLRTVTGDLKQATCNLSDVIGCHGGRLVPLREDMPEFGGEPHPTIDVMNADKVDTAGARGALAATQIYTAISTKGTIRVCHISPGDWDDPISCRLESRLIDGPDRYNCVSYAWGDFSSSAVITLNEHTLRIPQNLFRLLRRLRFRGTTSSIWIDALCINQNDDTEKTSQVAQMGVVYARAEEVVIWLGEHFAGEGLEDPTRYYYDIRQPFTFPILTSMMAFVASGCHWWQTPGTCCHLSSGGLVQERSDTMLGLLHAAIQRFIGAQWFSRTWTIQELALSPNAKLLIGNSAVSWHTIEAFRASLKDHLDDCCRSCAKINGAVVRSSGNAAAWVVMQDLHLLRGSLDNLAWFRIAKGLLRDLTLPPKARLRLLLWLIEEASWRNTTDPRDKIYALHGIGGPIFEGYKLNYNMSAVEVYKDFTTWMIVQSESLDVWDYLAFETATSPKRKLRGLPSWALDWTVANRHLLVFNQAARTDALSRNCAPGTCPVADAQANLLAVRGVHFDGTTRATTKSWPSSDQNIGDKVLRVLRSWIKFAISALSEEFGVNNSAMKTLCRVMTLDSVPLSRHSGRILPIREPQPWRRADAKYVANWLAWTARIQQLPSLGPDQYDKKPDWQFWHAVEFAAYGRRLFVTDASRLGLGPLTMQAGDEIFLLHGASNPYLLRENTDRTEHPSVPKTYAIIGPCYVDGVMDGELKDVLDSAETVYLR